jgi:cytoskeletal protein CcmA (bactofilin family)
MAKYRHHHAILSILCILAAFRTAQATCTLSDFKIYSKAGTKLSGSNQVTGNVGSNANVEIGASGGVAGNITAVGAVILRLNSFIAGNVTYCTSLTKESGVKVTGTTTKASSPSCTISSQSFSAGTSDVTVVAGQNKSLSPGSYRNIVVNGNGILSLRAGKYSVAVLQLDAGSHVSADGSNKISVEVRATSKITIGSNAVFASTEEIGTSPAKLYTNQTTQLIVGGKALVMGTLTAPNAEIKVSAGAIVQGKLYGNKVTFDAGSYLDGKVAHVQTGGWDEDLYKSTGTNVTDVFSGEDFRQAAYSLVGSGGTNETVLGNWETYVNAVHAASESAENRGGIHLMIAKEQFLSYADGQAPATRTFFMTAPSVEKVSGWDVTFIADPALVLSTDKVQSIQLEMDDGTILPLSPNGEAYYNLSHDGSIEATATVTFASGYVGKSKFKFAMETLSNGDTYR